MKKWRTFLCLDGPTMIVHISTGLMQLDVPRPVIAHQSTVWARYCRSTSRGRRGISHFILTSFRAAISETTLHKKWLNAVILHEYIHQWYCSNGGLQFTLVAMMRCINKANQNSSYNANYIEASNGTKLDMYIQHQRRQGETRSPTSFI
jgi:hypothetical protein